MPPSFSRVVLFSLLPTLAILGVVGLGFLGEPENNQWLNSSPLWQEGDPFFWEEGRELASPLLIYRGKPHYQKDWTSYGSTAHYQHNSLGLRDDEITVPKPAGVVRILNLGDSSTYGLALPARKDTYSDQLQQLLSCERGTSGCAVTYDVVNAGAIGYSSLQMLQYLRYYGRRLSPDIVTVYAGNNDWAPSGMKDAKRVAATASPIYEVLNRNFFYLFAQKAILKLQAATFHRNRSEFIDTLKGFESQNAASFPSKTGYYDTLARASPDEYEANLRGMIQVASTFGARVILIRPALNLPWPYMVAGVDVAVAVRPHDYWSAIYHADDYLAKVHAGKPACDRPLPNHPYLCVLTPGQILHHLDGTSPVDAPLPQVLEALRRRLQTPSSTSCERALKAHNWGVVLMTAERWAEAASALEAMEHEFASGGCSSTLQRGHGQYATGTLRLLQGDHATAKRLLWDARLTQPWAFSPDYSDRFDRVAAEGVAATVDATRAFEAQDPEYWGSRFIHDWVHPDPEGNRIIAEALQKQIVGSAK